jgi:hypothetical protein
LASRQITLSNGWSAPRTSAAVPSKQALSSDGSLLHSNVKPLIANERSAIKSTQAGRTRSPVCCRSPRILACRTKGDIPRSRSAHQ